MANTSESPFRPPDPERDQDITLTWHQGKWHWRAVGYRPGDACAKKVGEGAERSAAIAAAAAVRALNVFFEQEN